jgi:glycosyltransferase involved in cell wall biosynthesis
VSNDSSTDRTQQIITEFAKNSPNIKIRNQQKNLGLYQNMAFCARASTSKYFMWLAGDDYISSDFIENNVKFLEANPEYVASSSLPIFSFQDKSELGHAINLHGDLIDRLKNFFKYANYSHNVFYSVFKTETVKNFKYLGDSFAAADWAFDLYLISLGKVNTNSKGHIFLGTNGVSRSYGANRKFLKGDIDLIFPIWPLMKSVLRLPGFGYRAQCLLTRQFIALNLAQLYADIVVIKVLIKSKLKIHLNF